MGSKMRVGEAQDHQVFDGLLAQIMVDAEDLALVEMLANWLLISIALA